MSLDARYSRRAFLGLAAGVPVAATVTGCSGPSRPGAQQPSPHLRPRASRRLVSENALPGDPHWNIRHTGAPGAMMGYAGQASVLPGEAVPLHASTTARSFTVTAFRMGWYGGDLARGVWRSGTVPGHRQRKPALSLGHDEYWSPPERAHVTRARDSGMNIAFLGANACFRRTRLARTKLGERRLVICYKTSYQQDPQYGKDSALVTSDWREPPHPDPESSLTGTTVER